MNRLTTISHIAFEPAPKTIGNGPMKITPPTLPEPPSSTDATVSMTMPAMTMANPRKSKVTSLFETVAPSSLISVSFSFSDVSDSPQ